MILTADAVTLGLVSRYCFLKHINGSLCAHDHNRLQGV